MLYNVLTVDSKFSIASVKVSFLLILSVLKFNFSFYETVLSASPGKLLKVATAGRGRAAPVRRAALLETDPYEDFGMHERVAAKAAGPRVAALAAAEYDDVSYKRRVSSGAPRQLMAGRPRAALLDIDDV